MARNFLSHADRTFDRSLKRAFTGPAIVLANGPGLVETIRRAREFQPQVIEQAHVFALNSYVCHQELVGLSPNFYVLADPASLAHNLNDAFIDSHFKTSNRSAAYNLFVEEVHAVLNELVLLGIPTFVPRILQEHANRIGLNTIPFASTDLAANNISDITRPMGIPPLSAYVAVIAAHYLGFRPIYHAGFANNSWQTLSRSEESGLLEFEHRHFYEEDHNVRIRSYGESAADILAHFAQMYRIHDRMVRCLGLRNLDPTGLPL